MQLTNNYLKEILKYEPDTGVFYWLRACKGTAYGTKCVGIVTAGVGKQYCRIRIDQKDYLAHRLAFLYMTGSMPRYTVDHINGDGLDNRWANLRDVTIQENNKNLRMRSDNTTGITGVTRHSKADRYVAQITINGKNTYLGMFENIEDAALERRKAEIKHGFHKNHGVISHE